MKYLLNNFNGLAIRSIGLLVLFFCMTSMSANAQKVINGTVTDGDGIALIGVAVLIQGTNTV